MYCDTKECDVTYWLLQESLQWLIQFIWKWNKSKTNKEAKPKKVKLNGIKHQIKAFRRSPPLSLWTMIRRRWLGENTWIFYLLTLDMFGEWENTEWAREIWWPLQATKWHAFGYLTIETNQNGFFFPSHLFGRYATEDC